jgi:hypothetical protein
MGRVLGATEELLEIRWEAPLLRGSVPDFLIVEPHVLMFATMAEIKISSSLEQKS